MKHRRLKIGAAVVLSAAAAAVLAWRLLDDGDQVDQATLLKATQLQQELGTPPAEAAGPAAPVQQGNLGVDPPKGRAAGRAK